MVITTTLTSTSPDLKPKLKQASMRKATRSTKTPIATFFLIIISIFTFSSVIIIFQSNQKLPQSNPTITTSTSTSTDESQSQLTGNQFGNMMIDMLPLDLPFTIFLPSEQAFNQTLKLKVNESLKSEQLNDTVAVLSRVLGFSVVPRVVRSGDVSVDGKELDFDSLSGFRLGIWKEEDGRMLVNGIRSVSVDHSVKESVVHVMDGVIMDAEFEQAFREDDDDEDD